MGLPGPCPLWYINGQRTAEVCEPRQRGGGGRGGELGGGGMLSSPPPPRRAVRKGHAPLPCPGRRGRCSGRCRPPPHQTPPPSARPHRPGRVRGGDVGRLGTIPPPERRPSVGDGITPSRDDRTQPSTLTTWLLPKASFDLPAWIFNPTFLQMMPLTFRRSEGSWKEKTPGAT